MGIVFAVIFGVLSALSFGLAIWCILDAIRNREMAYMEVVVFCVIGLLILGTLGGVACHHALTSCA